MRSIGTRLALWYAGVSTATMVCLFVAGYYLLDSHLVHGLDLLDAAEFAQIRADLGPDAARLPPPRIAERMRGTSAVASVFFYVELHDRVRGVLFSSANLAATAPIAAA